ncbi:UPF0236 family protein [Mucilaginibacter sp. OK283]|uniref:UPF0236 family protein n=1 Tax=Mucilaginibacter sp. OK283 TaxID=1881049 RepID=UPI0008B2D04C|nr:UPF0236 family protein [Mucilaginibacter sp. OK283]SEO65428.1 Uncharacterised protein family (UPF0236) [Mucilaginibacter sp. OK283]
MQEKMVYAGQYDNYGSCNQLISKLMGQEISSAQVFRVTNAYGAELGIDEQAERSLAPVGQDEVVYAEIDGSMILTREGWKEVKLGRVFKSSDCATTGEKDRGLILESQYMAHLGDKNPFCRGMDELLDSYGGTKLKDRLMLINDGAVWIHNWCTDMYPNAIHVLDYYHACEHLHEFVGMAFKDAEAGKSWAQEQKDKLLESRAAEVIQAISDMTCSTKQAKENQANLINYYQSNLLRMDYASYKKLGYGIIGSGAIESAHRTIIQKRLKQSGQRWGLKGAQNVLNLRVTKGSGQWNKVIRNIKSAAQQAALTKLAA